jgi:hypothetical protein
METLAPTKRIGPPHNLINQPIKPILIKKKIVIVMPEIDAQLDDFVNESNGLTPLQMADPNIVYALHTFVANLEGQVCVLKGDSLNLLDNSNCYWWYVQSVKTGEAGYIPAENIEVFL